MVGLKFLNTKVLGFSIPRHINFEEVNFRFYTKYNNHGTRERGVVFIKEIVPKLAVSFISNNLYGEKYATMNMWHFHKENSESLEASYEWQFKKRWNKISAITDKRSTKRLFPIAAKVFLLIFIGDIQNLVAQKLINIM